MFSCVLEGKVSVVPRAHCFPPCVVGKVSEGIQVSEWKEGKSKITGRKAIICSSLRKRLQAVQAQAAGRCAARQNSTQMSHLFTRRRRGRSMRKNPCNMSCHVKLPNAWPCQCPSPLRAVAFSFFLVPSPGRHGDGGRPWHAGEEVMLFMHNVFVTYRLHALHVVIKWRMRQQMRH